MADSMKAPSSPSLGLHRPKLEKMGRITDFNQAPQSPEYAFPPSPPLPPNSGFDFLPTYPLTPQEFTPFARFSKFLLLRMLPGFSNGDKFPTPHSLLRLSDFTISKSLPRFVVPSPVLPWERWPMIRASFASSTSPSSLLHCPRASSPPSSSSSPATASSVLPLCDFLPFFLLLSHLPL